MSSFVTFLIKNNIGIGGLSWDKSIVIGQGAFGTSVFPGKFNHVKVAVKRIQKRGFVIVGQKFIQTHLSPTTQTHPNVIQYFTLESDQDFWSV